MTTAPVDVVAALIDAFNARDLERLLSYYHPDVVTEDGRGRTRTTGRGVVHALYRQLFSQSPQLLCEIGHRFSVGPYVVEEEHVTGFHLKGFPTHFTAGAVYRVDGDRIAHVRLLMQERIDVRDFWHDGRASA